jgi:hypothetical protein
LPALEDRFGLAPGPKATVAQRRAAVVAKEPRSRGAVTEHIVARLSDALGFAFVAYRPLAQSEANTWPPSPHLGPGVFARVGAPLFALRITEPINTGTVTVNYEPVDANASIPRPQVNSKWTINPGMPGMSQRVTITGSTDTTVTFVSSMAHDEDAEMVSFAPVWGSTKRHSFIVVATDADALDTEVRRKVHDVMSRYSRTVSTWSIVSKTTATHTGGFTLDGTPLGTRPLLSYPIVSP